MASVDGRGYLATHVWSEALEDVLREVDRLRRTEQKMVESSGECESCGGAQYYFGPEYGWNGYHTKDCPTHPPYLSTGYELAWHAPVLGKKEA
jgi:hypothetical protein